MLFPINIPDCATFKHFKNKTSVTQAHMVKKQNNKNTSFPDDRRLENEGKNTVVWNLKFF